MSVGTRLMERLSTPPFKFQVQCVRFVESNAGRALICDDMGLGKTFESIAWIALHPEVRPVICIVPATVKLNWQREWKQHAKIKTEVLEGKTPYTPRRDVLILNYEIAEAWAPLLAGMLQGKNGAVIFDECHYIKNRGAKRTKACRRVAAKAKRVLALSGTPITNAPAEFFPVLQMVKPKVFTSFMEFGFRYCDPRKGFGGRWEFKGATNTKELHERISPFMIRRLKSEVRKDLPKKRRIVVPVEITNRKAYEKARDDFVEWLEETEGEEAVQSAAGALSLVRLGKLLQLAADGKMRAAIQWIQDYLDGCDGKLVVFGIHKTVMEKLQRKFSTAASITGKTPVGKRQAQVDRFRNDPKCRLFLGQMKAAGTGTNGLQVADTTLTLELAWNMKTHEQAEDRILRIGQESQRVRNYYLIGRDTVEEWLLEVIQEKEIVVDAVLEGKRSKRAASLLDMMSRIK